LEWLKSLGLTVPPAQCVSGPKENRTREPQVEQKDHRTARKQSVDAYLFFEETYSAPVSSPIGWAKEKEKAALSLFP